MPTPSDPYAPIAEYYDLEHAGFRDDIDLLLSIADVVGGPILEMGCGTGRIVLSLAEAGHDVTGIDRSPAMLERARATVARPRVDGAVHLAEASMAEADAAPGGPFGLVIFSLNALMHLPTMAEQRVALRSAFRALDPRGQLILDLMHPTPGQLTALAEATVLEGSWSLPGGASVDKWAHRTIRLVDQVIDTVLWYDRVAPGGLVHRTRTRFPLRFVHPAELALMLELAGFTEIRMYGSYELDPLEDDSDRLFVTAEVTPSGGAAANND